MICYTDYGKVSMYNYEYSVGCQLSLYQMYILSNFYCLFYMFCLMINSLAETCRRNNSIRVALRNTLCVVVSFY